MGRLSGDLRQCRVRARRALQLESALAGQTAAQLADLTLAFRRRRAARESGDSLLPGKSMAIMLPAYLHATSGGGVHVATLDDHRARRDAAPATAVLGLFGVCVGFVTRSSSAKERRRAYAADITYGSYGQFAQRLSEERITYGAGGSDVATGMGSDPGSAGSTAPWRIVSGASWIIL